MDSTIVTDIIRRSNRNQLILWGIGLVLVLIAIAFSANHFYNLLAGPFEVTPEYITGIKNVLKLDKFYVTITGELTVDTTYSETRTTNGIETGKSYYKALYLDDKILLVKTGELANNTTFIGALQMIPPDERREVLDEILQEVPDLKDNFLLFMLDAGDFKGSGYAGLAATVIALVVCLWGVLRALGRIVNHERHAIWRNLHHFGEPSSIADQIDTELKSSGEQVGTVQVTRNWLVAAKKSTLGVTQLKDIMWIYKKVVNGRGGRRFYALVYDRHGQLTTISGKAAAIDETLRGIAQRMPWITIGYSKEIEKSWIKDRTGFIAAVDQRKQQGTS